MSWQRLLAMAKRPLLWRSYNSVLGLLKPLTSSCFLLRHFWERSVWPWLCTSHPSCWTRRPGSDLLRHLGKCLPHRPLAFTAPLFHYHPICPPAGAAWHTHLFFLLLQNKAPFSFRLFHTLTTLNFPLNWIIFLLWCISFVYTTVCITLTTYITYFPLYTTNTTIKLIM